MINHPNDYFAQSMKYYEMKASQSAPSSQATPAVGSQGSQPSQSSQAGAPTPAKVNVSCGGLRAILENRESTYVAACAAHTLIGRKPGDTGISYAALRITHEKGDKHFSSQHSY